MHEAAAPSTIENPLRLQKCLNHPTAINYINKNNLKSN